MSEAVQIQKWCERCAALISAFAHNVGPARLALTCPRLFLT